MDDGRRDLPYAPNAPYLMFKIERVSGQRFPKDCFHQPYKIKKTHGGIAPAHRAESPQEEIPEASHSRSRRQKNASWKKKVGSWLKAILGIAPMPQREHIRLSLSRGSYVVTTFLHLLLFHLHLSFTLLASQIVSQMMERVMSRISQTSDGMRHSPVFNRDMLPGARHVLLAS